MLVTSRHLGSPTPGLNRDYVVHIRLARDGSRLGEVGWSRRRNVDFVMQKLGPNMHDQAFGPTGAAVVSGNGVLHTEGRVPQVTRRAPDGTIAQLIRWLEEPTPVTAADREAFAVDRRAGAPNEYERMKVDEWLNFASWATTLPMSGVLVARPDGGFLVAAHCAAADSRCAWREFDATGRWSRTLLLPVRAEDAVVTGDLLVTLTVDAVGLERLEAWPLR